MKEDAPPPKHPPAKRRRLDRAPDYWLAVWANDDELSEDERARAQEVRDQRKVAKPDRIMGVIVDHEDVTPEQLEGLKTALSGATAIHHPWTTRRVAGVCRRAGAPVTTHQTLRDVVLASTTIVGAPRAPEDPHNRTPAWEALNYAKHRRLPMTVVLPNGTVERRS